MRDCSQLSIQKVISQQYKIIPRGAGNELIAGLIESLEACREVSPVLVRRL